ncbi:TY-Chap domain-containing protein [Actinomadura harenae]|uniref:TY-Chap N-terminal domain-containing protein n=1 Tax=Actinomadura harenae TaxID=2483351 RepID=A0A3M2MCH6_9ACTN|nr:hypothetical protein [Actinomadura harenae]RMI47229.1 hypothetical protein EBO15_03325 [Actinomadura harenae]
MVPTDDQIRELVRRFATLDMTGWDDAAFDRAAAHLGWRPVTDDAGARPSRTEWYDTGIGTGQGYLARNGADDEGSTVSVSMGDGDELFLRVRSALVDELGAASIMRGPGPLLRWRGPVRLLELERIGDRAHLAVRPTEAVENDEYRTAKWAEPDDGLGLLGYWQVIGRGPELDGTSFPGGYWADDWTEFEERLATTLSAVVRDFALLDGPGHFTVVVRTPGDRRFVQWTTDEDWTLHIEAGRPSDADAAWPDAMTALGWDLANTPDDEPCVAHAFPALDVDGAATAARMLVGALRSFGVAFEDLWHQVISPNVDLLGIGIPTRHGDRF